MDDNTYECPSCGARIYPEMTRCPNCGHNMYPEDEETVSNEAQTGASNWGTMLGAIFTGWLIACGIALILHFIVSRFVTAAMLGSGGKTVLFMSGPIGALAGGYISSGLAKRSSFSLGGLVGILSLPVSALLATHWVEVTLTLLFGPWFLGAGLLIILAGTLGGWLNQNFSLDREWQEKWKVRGWEDFLYQELLRKVRFNGSAADRLIDYERKQDPQATRFKLIQNAIERLERDNR